MRIDAICLAFILSLLANEIAAQDNPVAQKPSDNILAVLERYDEHFARLGTDRGTGFKQYMRWLDFAEPRTSPSGSLVNISALTFLHHHQAARSPDVASRRAAAVAAGIGTGDWRWVGPTPAAQAQEGDGDIGRINAIAFHPTEPATLYAGTPAGGLWRTRDDGATWAAMTDDLALIGVQDVVIDPLSPGTIYVLSGDGDGRHVSSLGVLKSIDDGRSWLLTGLTWDIRKLEYGYRLAIHPTSPAILLAATTTGLLRTADGAQTWKPVLQQAQGDRANPFFDIQFHPTNPSIAYAASRTNVYRSRDAGQTWTPLAGGLPDARNSARIRLAVTPASPNTLYVLYGAEDGFSIGLYRSDDGGDTFARRSNSNPRPANVNTPPPFDLTKSNILGWDPNDFVSQASYDLAMTVSPTNVDRVHVGAIDTWRSDDGGRTWKPTSKWSSSRKDDYTHADIHVLAYRGDSLYVGSDGGIYRSNNGGETWSSITNATTGMGIAQIYALCITPQDPNLIYYGSQDNGTWRLRLDGELKKVNGGDGFVCQINPTRSRTVYSSVQFGKLYRSEDGGQNFSRNITPTVGDSQLSGAWLTPYALAPGDPDTIYACYADLWRGTGPLPEWKNITNGALGPSPQCRQVAVAPSDPNTIYVAKSGGMSSSWRDFDRTGRTPFFGGGGVFRSTDGGTTWQTVTGTLPLSRAMLTNFAVSPTDPRRAWITFSGYDAAVKVFGTTDGGASWTNLSAGLPNLPVSAIAAANVPSSGIYVGTDDGVYYRDDRLATWVEFRDRLPKVAVTQLVIDQPRQRMFAATFGRGIWQTDIRPPCLENCASPARPEATSSRAPSLPGSGSFTGPLDAFE